MISTPFEATSGITQWISEIWDFIGFDQYKK
jgi:hypothetical protein